MKAAFVCAATCVQGTGWISHVSDFRVIDIDRLLLGVLALSALLVKRWRERPQRPLKVFYYDASKQALIALVAHLFNMLVALMLKAQTHEDAAVADEPVEILQNTISDRARRIAQHGSEAHSC